MLIPADRRARHNTDRYRRGFSSGYFGFSGISLGFGTDRGRHVDARSRGVALKLPFYLVAIGRSSEFWKTEDVRVGTLLGFVEDVIISLWCRCTETNPPHELPTSNQTPVKPSGRELFPKKRYSRRLLMQFPGCFTGSALNPLLSYQKSRDEINVPIIIPSC